MTRFFLYTLLLFSLIQGCIEPFSFQTESFEGVLVVDARLTNEVKQHQVFLSRARPFEQDSVIPERNAVVSIRESSGVMFNFEEAAPGIYVSSQSFGAKTNESYRLLITTSNGATYSSTDEIMPENISIGEVTVKRETNDFGEDGVSILVDNTSRSNQPRYFRYDYKENYEIRAPNWDPFTFDIIDSIACTDGDAFEVGIKPKNSLKGRICYGERLSTEIILASTANLDENTILDFPVRFINRENYILTHRYSIQVNQYTQNTDAFSYYQNLEAFSSSESVFTDTQPGFLLGNISSETNSDEKVIGYFETAAVSSKRIFFNYEDIFPEEPLPEYPINCANLGAPRLIPRGYHCTMGSSGVCDGNCESPLISQIQANLIVFAAEIDPPSFVTPFFTLPRGCGDCTLLGSDVKPDFWID